MKELLKKDFAEWSRNELLDGIALVKVWIRAMEAGDLADMRVGLTEPDTEATGRVLDESFRQQTRLRDFQRQFEVELAKRPIPIIEHPRDAGDWLIYHKNYGWLQGRFSKAGDEGVSRWFLGGDLFDVEVSEDGDPILRDQPLYNDGPVTHYLPLPILPREGA